MYWKNITEEIIPTSEAMRNAIEEYYDVESDLYTSVEAVVDIQELENANPQDVIIGVKLHNKSLYILQMRFSKGVYLKKITPSYTYIYSLGYFPWIYVEGSITPYSAFEVLSDRVVLFKSLYIDLGIKALFLLEPNEFVATGRKPGFISYLPIKASTKRINNYTWLTLNTNTMDMKLYITIYQKVSFIDCLECKDKKDLIEAIGGKERANSIECEQEDFGILRAIDINSVGETFKVPNRHLKTLQITKGICEDKDKLSTDRETNIVKCVDSIKRMAKILNRFDFGSDAVNYFEDISKWCTYDMMNAGIEYIMGAIVSKKLYESFLKDYYSGNVDYDEFYKKVKERASKFTKAISAIKNSSDNLYEQIQTAKLLFSDRILWGTYLIYLKWNEFKEKYYNKETKKWELFNPYKEVADYSFDDFIKYVFNNLPKSDIGRYFEIRKFTMKFKERFGDKATYYSLGPAGCISAIKLEEVPITEMDIVCDVEIIGGDIIIWTYRDLSIQERPFVTYLENILRVPNYEINVYKVDLEKKKLIKIATSEIPQHFNPLDHRKMAVAIKKDKSGVLIADFYLKSYNKKDVKAEIDYVIYERDFHPTLKTIASKSRAVRFYQNINVNMWFDAYKYNWSLNLVSNAEDRIKDLGAYYVDVYDLVGTLNSLGKG